MEDMFLMSKDKCVARIVNDKLKVNDNNLLPIGIKWTEDVISWLAHRAVDRRRINARPLKRALRLENKDDVHTVLKFNAATITDTYWMKPTDSSLTYDEVRFKENLFDMLALKGDINSFNQKPSRTPELTNTGSFEKCWRLIDGSWWMYKSGNAQEKFTEVFAYHLAKELGIPTAVYEVDGEYVRSKDFTNGAKVNFETAYGIIGEEVEYPAIYRKLKEIDEGVAASYVQMTYFDALIFNMDRHEHNFGVLRDIETGEILGMAPLYDHNIALITRGYLSDVQRRKDRLIGDFIDLVKEESISFDVPELTAAMVETALQKTPVELSETEEIPVPPREYVAAFILNGQARIQKELEPLNKRRLEQGR